MAAGTLALLGWLGVAHTLRAHAAPAAVALVVALAAGVAAARVLQRHPLALPFAACLAAPFRFPVHIGSQDANLLVPLYAVIGVAWLALVLDALRGSAPVRLPPRRLALPLLLFVAWEAVSLAWSDSASEGAKAMAFYALPFGVLLAALVAHPPPLPRLAGAAASAGRPGARIRGRRRLPGAPARHLVEPQAHGLERVQLVLPRELDLLRPLDLRALPGGDDHARVRGAAVRLGAAAARGRDRRGAGLGRNPRRSYSQSALLALCVAVGAGLVLTFGRRLAWLLLLGALAVGLGLLAVPSVRHAGVDRVTSKRSGLVGDGLRLFKAHPLAGVGLGGSTQAAREQTDRGRAVRHAQHVMPLTVASELGIVGVALLAWLLTVLARLALMRPFRPERLALGLALLAIFVHSLFYAAFFEDPLTWGLAALLAACAAPGMIEER